MAISASSRATATRVASARRDPRDQRPAPPDAAPSARSRSRARGLAARSSAPAAQDQLLAHPLRSALTHATCSASHPANASASATLHSRKPCTRGSRCDGASLSGSESHTPPARSPPRRLGARGAPPRRRGTSWGPRGNRPRQSRNFSSTANPSLVAPALLRNWSTSSPTSVKWSTTSSRPRSRATAVLSRTNPPSKRREIHALTGNTIFPVTSTRPLRRRSAVALALQALGARPQHRREGHIPCHIRRRGR